MNVLHAALIGRARPAIRAMLGACVAWLAFATLEARAVEQPPFTSALDDSPLIVKPLPKEVVTDAVTKFYQTGVDPYKGDPAALVEGKALYLQWCQSCHMPDGSGRMGPSFLTDSHHYARFTSDKGMFEIVYGGATGAMQAFGNRLTQDQILHVMAYVRAFKK